MARYSRRWDHETGSYCPEPLLNAGPQHSGGIAEHVRGQDTAAKDTGHFIYAARSDLVNNGQAYETLG